MMRRLSTERSGRACGLTAALAVCAGTTTGVAQTGADCNGDKVPDDLQRLVWVSPEPGVFGSGAPWQNPGAPGAGPGPDSVVVFDPAQSGVGGALADVLAPDRSIAGLEVASGQVGLRLVGRATLSVTGSLPGCRETVVGTERGGDALLNAQGEGVFSFDRLVVAAARSSVADLFFTDFGSNALDVEIGELVLGALGVGRASAAGARVWSRGPMILGEQPGSIGALAVSQPGGVLAVGSDAALPVVVGAGGEGVLRLADGAEMISDGSPLDLVLGDQPGSVGTFTVSGTASQPAAGSLSLSSFDIGRFGSGVLNVSGFSVLNTGVVTPVGVAAFEGSTGRVEIGNGLWSEARSPVWVGVRGFGTVQIAEPGELVAATRLLRRGTLGGSGRVEGPLTVGGGRLVPGAGAGVESDRVLELRGPVSLTAIDPLDGLAERGRLIVGLDGFDFREFGSVLVDTDATLGGTLAVEANPTLTPEVGDAAMVLKAADITGRFDGFTAPIFANGTTLELSYQPDGALVTVVPRRGAEPDFEAPLGFQTIEQLTQRAFATGDLTGDGLPDLVVSLDGPGEDNGFIAVLRNRGVDTEGSWLGYAEPDVYSSFESRPVSLAIADFNGDKLNDVVWVSRSRPGAPPGGVVRLRLNNPSLPGDLSNASRPPVFIENDPVDLAVGDADGEGQPEVFVAGTVPGTELRSDRVPAGGRGGLGRTRSGRVTIVNDEEETEDDIDIGVQPGSIDTYGSDRVESKDDIGVTCLGESMVFSLQNDGSGNYPTFDAEAVGAAPVSLDSADLDGDGSPELLTSDRDSGTVSVLRSVPGSTPLDFDPAVSFEADDMPGSEPVSGVFVDLDGDDDLDIAVIARDDGGVPRVRRLLFEGLGDAGELVFTAAADAAPPQPGEPTPIELVTDDVDGDGDEDLIVLYAEASGEVGGRMVVPLPTADVSVRLNAGAPCVADLAFPFGVLDIDDVDAFIAAFLSGSPTADLAFAFGVLDIDDIDAFITAFLAGCP